MATLVLGLLPAFAVFAYGLAILIGLSRVVLACITPPTSRRCRARHLVCKRDTKPHLSRATSNVVSTRKLLYAVQATGNGHLARARTLAPALAQQPNLQVDYLFSGRSRAQLFDMQAFGAFRCRRGLTLFYAAAASIRSTPSAKTTGAR